MGSLPSDDLTCANSPYIERLRGACDWIGYNQRPASDVPAVSAGVKGCWKWRLYPPPRSRWQLARLGTTLRASEMILLALTGDGVDAELWTETTARGTCEGISPTPASRHSLRPGVSIRGLHSLPMMSRSPRVRASFPSSLPLDPRLARQGIMLSRPSVVSLQNIRPGLLSSLRTSSRREARARDKFEDAPKPVS